MDEREQLNKGLQFELGKLYPECNYIPVDLGEFTGYICLVFKELKISEQQEILSRFGKLGRLLWDFLEMDIIKYWININLEAFSSEGMIIYINFEFHE